MVFRSVTREQALEAAEVLVRPLCIGIATYIINEHWQVVMVDTGSSYRLSFFEKMKDETGFLKGLSFEYKKLDKHVIADRIFTLIAAATEEWNECEREFAS